MTTFQNPSDFDLPKPSTLAKANALVVIELLEKQPNTSIDGGEPVDAAKVKWLVVDGPDRGWAEERQLVNAALVRMLLSPKARPGHVFIGRLATKLTTSGRSAVVLADASAEDRKAAEAAWSAYINGDGAEPPF